MTSGETEPFLREGPPRGDQLRVVPLGGLGEIGMNCLALEQADGILIVDCGITFPNEDLGVDTYHPDLSYLSARAGRVSGVFLTHGHEDHVGALPYLLGALRVPVWGPPHALAVARHRLMERGLDPERFQFVTVAPRTVYGVGPFEVEPIRVTHSITDATALAIRTRGGTVVHTGDFRFDPAPIDGELTDEARLADLGDAGVRLLLSDSTNVDARSPHISETEVAETLDVLVRSAARRVVIGLFASNIQRLRTIGEVCRRAGRKIALFGRSIELQVQWAHDIGRLAWPSDLLIAKDQASGTAPDRLVVLAGGTQAEVGSSLVRLAARAHPQLTLDPGDTVVLSSRVIPGNDRPVFDMMADYLRQGVIVKSWITDPTVHTSGHAHRDEQKKMIDLVRPRAFIPVHGTRHHLERHAELAREAGVGEVAVIENGQVASIEAERTRIEGRVPVGRVATWEGSVIGEPVLRDRRLLARSGALSIGLALDSKGRLASRPSVQARGVVAADDEASTLRFVALEVAKALEGAPAARDDDAIAEIARLAARRAIETRTGRKPVCLVTLVRV
jgi:ribonuclease J